MCVCVTAQTSHTKNNLSSFTSAAAWLEVYSAVSALTFSNRSVLISWLHASCSTSSSSSLLLLLLLETEQPASYTPDSISAAVRFMFHTVCTSWWFQGEHESQRTWCWTVKRVSGGPDYDREGPSQDLWEKVPTVWSAPHLFITLMFSSTVFQSLIKSKIVNFWQWYRSINQLSAFCCYKLLELYLPLKIHYQLTFILFFYPLWGGLGETGPNSVMSK